MDILVFKILFKAFPNIKKEEVNCADQQWCSTQIAKFMGPTWVLSARDGPHVGPMNLAIWGSDPLPCLVTVYAGQSVNVSAPNNAMEHLCQSHTQCRYIALGITNNFLFPDVRWCNHYAWLLPSRNIWGVLCHNQVSRAGTSNYRAVQLVFKYIPLDIHRRCLLFL